MAASARWAYGGHQSALLGAFDEVSVLRSVSYIFLAPFPGGLCRTHMEVICLNSSAEGETRGGGLLDFWEPESNLRGWDWVLVYFSECLGNLGFSQNCL